MGRKTIETGVREAFEFDEKENTSKCMLCSKSIAGKHLGNMKAHLKRKHKDIVSEICNPHEELQEEQVEKKCKISLQYDKTEVLDAWLNLVIKEGRPFCVLDSECLRTLVKPIFEALKLPMVSSSNVSSEIKLRAGKLRQHISKILQNKIVSIKVDSATRHTRRVVGINAQTIIGGQLITQTLSMTEIHRSHSGQNLKTHVMEVLKLYVL